MKPRRSRRRGPPMASPLQDMTEGAELGLVIKVLAQAQAEQQARRAAAFEELCRLPQDVER